MENTKNYDVVIIGGGVSGCACAWNCGKLGLKTLLVEKKSYLGGAISGGLVVPVMKTDDNGINVDFYRELVNMANVFDAQITYSDMNKGWFNPELIKIVLDRMMISAGIDIYFNSDIYDITTTVNASTLEKLKEVLTCDIKSISQTYNDKHIKQILLKRNVLSYYDETTHTDNIDNSKIKENFKNLFQKVSAKYYVDASGDAIIAELLNARMQPDNDKKQAETLRFVMSNVDAREFSRWLLETDKDRNVTSVTSTLNKEFYMTTAYTWDPDKHWGLEDVFHTAISNGDLEEEDTAYFQLFGIAKMFNSVVFNCPQVDPNLPYEEKLMNARAAIYRIANFCKLYFPGFGNACISHISEELGVRVSNRPLTVYNYTIEDIAEQCEYENIALHSNYPVDIHSTEKGGRTFDANKGYNLPIESLISADYNNLFHIGKAIGADFESQSALRVQKSCFSMGEAVAKYMKENIKGLEDDEPDTQD